MTRERDIEQRVLALAEPLAATRGLEVVQVQYRREAGGFVLRLFLDRSGGVTIDDCSDFSREFSDVLDVEDPIPGRYALEVSSPGLDRPLCRERDFVRFAGRLVTLSSAEPVEGRRHFKGTLLGATDGVVRLRVDGREYSIALSNVSKANLVPEP
ncbi:MAG: ribosome maturation factor RimP [Myxococcales bacterium]|nr:ribosome maturation factor RimP [Myxococcales bacterium]